jgi:pimeloyl-ACP methyl ester carboxylesterase
MGVPRTTQAASRGPTPRRAAGRSAAERRCGTTGAAMRRSANRPPRGVADAYRPPPGSWHDGAKHEARRATMSTERMTVNGIELEVLRHGGGTPVLLLHGPDTVPPRAAFLDLLGRDAEIIAPSSPGFGDTKRPADFDTIYDLVHLYLAVLDQLPYERVALLGLSFGGWLAAEVAVASCHRLSKLILVDPVGIKLGDATDRDILDVFNVNPAEVRRCSWHDPAKAPDYDAMTDEELVIHARNWEALCLYAWHPYMYNPQLKRWLGHIRVPTLMLWGASDGVVPPDYGRAYSRLIPGARFEIIEEAGHHPELEQPERFAERVAAFLRE